LARHRARLARVALHFAQPPRDLLLRRADALARVEPEERGERRRERDGRQGEHELQARRARRPGRRGLRRNLAHEPLKYATSASIISSSPGPPILTSRAPRRRAACAMRGWETKSGL